ncbi:MAG TPA: SusC/RagA family TonB-linked outer membrane protein [Bacteroidales bacterium]|nr:SusC/RagA family TonB-linked outer membrane protein [Bacteroidales bacterium]
MRLSALFLMFLSLNLSASVYSQNTRFTVDLNGKTVREVFQFIEQKSEFRFFYNDDFAYIDKVVDMNVKDENVEQILEHLFESSDITYKVFDNNLIVLTLKQNLQQVAVKGTVTDAASKEPLPGTNIQIKGTTMGTTADASGAFSLEAKKGDVLIVSFIGYVAQEITVGDETMLNIALAPDATNLEEVVVVGYGTQKRTEVTGAIASVSSEKLTALPSASLDQALQGRAAGLTVIANGAPGTMPTMRIRGISTVNDANPLYVVDGVITTNIGNISPSDIESIEVLKDASTAAIYGSQGSNGVIMVTTKKGKAGKVLVNFEGYTGVQYSNARYDVMNAAQYEEYARGGAFATPQIYSDPNNLVYTNRLAGIGPDRPNGGETDWQDEIYQKGPMQNYDLSVTGGGENSSFRLSAGYLNQRGIIIKTGLERYNFRANSDYTKGRLKIGENLSLSYSSQDPLADNGGRSLLEHAIKIAPYLPIYNHENKRGGYQGPSNDIDGQDAENPVRIMELNRRNRNTMDILGNIYGELEIIKGLKFRTNLGLQDQRLVDNQFYPSYNDDDLTGTTHRQPFSSTFKNRANYTSFLFTNGFTWNTTLADKHNFEVLALTEYNAAHSTVLNANSHNKITDFVPELNNTDVSLSSTTTDWYRISYVGRVNYNYEDKYLLSASIRTDASSRFGKNNRWGTFKSFSAGWNIAKESFMESIPVISNLKLRGSWGEAGNDKIKDYSYIATLTSDMYYVIDNKAVQGTTPGGQANPDLKWEETTMTNIGIDLGLLRNQFTLTAEYYMNKSDDLLMQVGNVLSFGDFQGTTSRNAGSMETKGFELQLGYNDFEGAFQWSAGLNLGTFKNEVKSLGGNPYISGFGFEGEDLNRNEIGQPAFFFYGWKFDGIFQSEQEVLDYMDGSQRAMTTSTSAGDFRIKDTNHDGVITGADRTNIGNPFPKMTLGFDLNASFKGFDLNLFISGVYGNKIYNTNIYDLEGMPRLFNASPKVLHRWTPTSPSTTMPRAGVVGDNLKASDRYIEDGAYTKLKNISLGYTIPSSILKNKVTKLRIYVSAQNLICITKYSGLDPEVGSYSTAGTTLGQIGVPVSTTQNYANGIDVGNYPIPKSVIAGFQITF